MSDDVAAYRQIIRKKLEPLEDVFTKALLGDFSDELEIPKDEDELSPVFVGISVLLGSINEQIENYEQLNGHMAEEIKKQTADLQRQNKVLEAVSFAAGQFLQRKDWQRTVKNVLERLGEAMDASRVYIFDMIDEKREVSHQLYEWTAPGVPAFIADPALQHFSFPENGFDRWVEVMKEGKFIGGNIKTFPSSEQQELKRQGIYALMIFPIFDDDVWWGFIGFDETRQEREWTDNEIAALETAASLLGIAIHYYRIEKEISARTRELEVLNKAMIGRELKMIELKRKIKKLESKVAG